MRIEGIRRLIEMTKTLEQAISDLRVWVDENDLKKYYENFTVVEDLKTVRERAMQEVTRM